MKARVISQEDREAVAFINHLYQSMLCSVLGAESVACIAVKRFFGLGNKRMCAFLDYLEEVKDEFDQHGTDGVFDTMMKREFAEIGIDVTKHLIKRETLDHAVENIKRKIKPDVTQKEATQIQSQMQSFRNVLR